MNFQDSPHRAYGKELQQILWLAQTPNSIMFVENKERQLELQKRYPKLKDKFKTGEDMANGK